MDKFVMEKQELRTELQKGVFKVVFTKVDGSERTMLATLVPDLLPVQENKSERTVKENPDTLRVFDLEKQEWRSFRVANVISFELEQIQIVIPGGLIWITDRN